MDICNLAEMAQNHWHWVSKIVPSQSKVEYTVTKSPALSKGKEKQEKPENRQNAQGIDDTYSLKKLGRPTGQAVKE